MKNRNAIANRPYTIKQSKKKRKSSESLTFDTENTPNNAQSQYSVVFTQKNPKTTQTVLNDIGNMPIVQVSNKYSEPAIFLYSMSDNQINKSIE
jgi:hypothetical protein